MPADRPRTSYRARKPDESPTTGDPGQASASHASLPELPEHRAPLARTIGLVIRRPTQSTTVRGARGTSRAMLSRNGTRSRERHRSRRQRAPRQTAAQDRLEARARGRRDARVGARRDAPTTGNKVQVLIDGASFLPSLAEELAQAESHVHLTGWNFSPELELTRGEAPAVLRTCSPSSPTGSTCACSSGAAPRCRSSGRPGATCGKSSSDSAAGTGSSVSSTPVSGSCTAITRRRSSSTTAWRSSVASTSRSTEEIRTTPRSIRPGAESVGMTSRFASRARRRRRRRALPPALARCSRRGAPGPDGSRRSGRHRPPDRSHDPGERLREVTSARRLLRARVLRQCDPVGTAADLHREPVSLVVRDRRAHRREAARSSARRLPRRPPTARECERRRRRFTRPGRRPHSGRRPQRAVPRLLRLRTHGQAARSDLRALEGRDRGRPLADRRLGQPQRALALQRLRGQRRRARRKPSHETRASASGPSISSFPSTRSTGTPRQSSTSGGSRSRRNSSSAWRTTSR